MADIPRKKRKTEKFNLSRFIDDAAEESAGEESHGSEGVEGKEDEFDRYAEQAAKKRAERRKQANTVDFERDAQAVADYYETKTRQQAESEVAAPVQTGFDPGKLPAVDSPKLWLVGCRKGKEREAAINLMNKFMALQRTRDALEIYSVFSSDHLKESIYVEAYKKVHVVNAIKGMHILFENRIEIIPINQMADVFNMDSVQKLPFKPGSFVRIKTGDYKGDLAQVVSIEDQRTKAVVKLVPRLNKTGNKKIRPQQRMFNPADYPTAERKHDKNTSEMYHFYNGMQFMNGFLHKKMSIKSLQAENIHLTFEESNIFKGTTENLPTRKITYCKGDKIKILRGELKNLAGTIVSSTETNLTIQPQHKDLEHMTLDLYINEVCKYFENGDHVKVINGRYNGQTGLVLATDEESVKLLGDISKDHFTVLAQDLQLTDEVALGQAFNKKFNVNDVATLNNEQGFGLIIKVEIDCIIAIMDNGEQRVLRAIEINKVFPPKKSICTDKDGNALSVGDMVKVTSAYSDYKDKLGTVRNTLRGTLFLQNNEFVETSGIFPVKSRACILLGAQNLIGNEQAMRRDELINKTVMITAGAYRNSIGKVLEVLRNGNARILTQQNKTLMVERSILQPVSADQAGRSSMPAAHQSPWRPQNTPTYDMASPWHSETPGHTTPGQEWKDYMH